MKLALQKLGDFVVVSGATKEKMLEQLDGLECFIMAQSGNDCALWTNELSAYEKGEVQRHMGLYKEWLEPWHKTADMVQDRGCQISVSLTGHNAPLSLKQSCDASKQFRQWILLAHPFESKTLKCSIGGNTCLDYTRKDGDKGSNVSRYVREKGFDRNQCVYYGDGLFPGGNDESVIGMIPTVPVNNPQDLLEKLLALETKQAYNKINNAS